ncbi:unnamed protein product [Arabis nemorensis]|uniref:Uncharacterized protein n=1 Tax=Arabis nemorensis TaxID=586526 RepID=A0A565ARG0_9BRAS|nr:unnamed protein product [Arabis nemorensis]
MQDTLQRIPTDPNSKRHDWVFISAHHQNSRSDRYESQIPNDIENHHRLRICPIALPFLELLRRSFPHNHRRLSHRSAATSTAQKPRRFPQSLSPHGSPFSVDRLTVPGTCSAIASLIIISAQKQRCRIDSVGGKMARQ